MKTIVISGARSNIGKTTLAGKVSGLLPGSVLVKLGHGEEKKGVDNVFYHEGTSFARIVEENPQADFLIIESNRILEETVPDLVIYLPAEDPKPSAALAEERADLVRGCEVTEKIVGFIAGRLGIGTGTAERIAGMVCEAGAPGMDKADGQ